VLVVLPFPPLPEGAAAARCAVGLLGGLATHGLDYRVLAAGAGEIAFANLPAKSSVEMVHVELPSRSQARRERLLHPKGLLARGAFAERLKVLARDADIVHFVEAQTAVALSLVDKPAVVQLHFLTRRDRSITGPWNREGRIAIELLRAEVSVRRRARWLLANSSEVADQLRASTPKAHVSVAPLALDPAHYTPRAQLSNPTAGLIGTARWPPTRRAVERLLTSVWPLVRERREDARLLLAGQDMERSKFAHLPDLPGVEWRASVPSASDFLRELGVLAYPLSSGSGAKVKVLESMALGVPVVTTPDGAEGLGGLGGIAVETDDRRLADALVALLDDPAARSVAGERAYGTFCEHHSPHVAATPVVKLYEQMLA
jgi:polysaccharide biosynthesis protein PslH